MAERTIEYEKPLDDGKEDDIMSKKGTSHAWHFRQEQRRGAVRALVVGELQNCSTSPTSLSLFC